MSGYGRNYVSGDNPMYRAVNPYDHRWRGGAWATADNSVGVRYAGPYATKGAAKGQCDPGGWVEVCRPVWEKLEE